eukprot:PhM_4_TR3563/c0_g2_i1/m.9999
MQELDEDFFGDFGLDPATSSSSLPPSSAGEGHHHHYQQQLHDDHHDHNHHHETCSSSDAPMTPTPFPHPSITSDAALATHVLSAITRMGGTMSGQRASSKRSRSESKLRAGTATPPPSSPSLVVVADDSHDQAPATPPPPSPPLGDNEIDDTLLGFEYERVDHGEMSNRSIPRWRRVPSALKSGDAEHHQHHHQLLPARVPWSREEDTRLTMCLQQFGTDFFVMEKFFPGKSRNHVKRRFDALRRRNPELLDHAMANPHVYFTPHDIAAFEKAYEAKLKGETFELPPQPVMGGGSEEDDVQIDYDDEDVSLLESLGMRHNSNKNKSKTTGSHPQATTQPKRKSSPITKQSVIPVVISAPETQAQKYS